ncbi:MAG TPA: TadE/TadG family type IV pilus assembly protein [Rhizomicrobium sp.]|nr:TadE/TadG family type IV pilus assembly protein [Rhizomicrobium sp.]
MDNLIRTKARDIRKDTSGVAAIEFAPIAVILIYALLNVTDVSFFLYDKAQVEEATQMGAQAAWRACNGSLPATVNCAGLNAAVTNAVQSTSLSTSVAVKTGSPSEGYYCASSTGTLQLVGSVSSSEPASCSAAGVASTTPADYVKIQTTYSYTPLLTDLSIGSLLPTSITSTAWERLGDQ